jgi:hypothetical protein
LGNLETADVSVNHAKRIAKLKAIFEIDDRIPIYVEDERDLQTRIEELIAAGALAEADRPRCVFWLRYRRYGRWQVNDEAALRLKAQAAIKTPCATWLTAGETRADAGAGEQATRNDGTAAPC